MYGRLSHCELLLLLFWFVSLGSNMTESNSFFKSSDKSFENKSFFLNVRNLEEATLERINQKKY